MEFVEVFAGCRLCGAGKRAKNLLLKSGSEKKLLWKRGTTGKNVVAGGSVVVDSWIP